MSKSWMFIVAAASVAVACTANPTWAQAPAGYTLVWSDEFNGPVGSQPNSGTWSYDTGAGGWGNNELETYVTSQANCHIVNDNTGSDGLALQIEPQTDSYGNWYSARINTNGKKSVGPYGYFEYRCKFPGGGQGYWPAAWMLGTNLGSVGWPACGEIDIAEQINSQNNNNGSLHAPNWNPTAQVGVNNACGEYHNYGANWQPNYVTFYVDGNAYETQTSSSGPAGSWVFTGTDFLLINCAIGGNWPGYPNSGTQANANFDIDYVRQYEWTGNGNVLYANNQLDPGQQISYGTHSFVMQTDGNLVEYNGSSPIWASNTSGHSGAYCKMQDDGNLCVYASNGSCLWASGSWGHPGSYCTLQSDGNVVIYGSGGSPAYWATGTNGR